MQEERKAGGARSRTHLLPSPLPAFLIKRQKSPLHRFIQPGFVIHPSLARSSPSRKQGLDLVVSTQFPGQIPPDAMANATRLPGRSEPPEAQGDETQALARGLRGRRGGAEGSACT